MKQSQKPVYWELGLLINCFCTPHTLGKQVNLGFSISLKLELIGQRWGSKVPGNFRLSSLQVQMLKERTQIQCKAPWLTLGIFFSTRDTWNKDLRYSSLELHCSQNRNMPAEHQMQKHFFSFSSWKANRVNLWCHIPVSQLVTPGDCVKIPQTGDQI